jgi:hypothetical protein
MSPCVFERVRRDIACLPLKAESVEGASDAVSELAVSVQVNLMAERHLAFESFAFDSERRTAPRKLTLTLRQDVLAAEVTDDLEHDVAEATSPARVAWATSDEQAFAVRHGAPCPADGSVLRLVR